MRQSGSASGCPADTAMSVQPLYRACVLRRGATDHLLCNKNAFQAKYVHAGDRIAALPWPALIRPEEEMHRFQESEAAAGEFLRPGMRPFDVNHQPASRRLQGSIRIQPPSRFVRVLVFHGTGLATPLTGLQGNQVHSTQDKLVPMGPCGFGLRHRKARGVGLMP